MQITNKKGSDYMPANNNTLFRYNAPFGTLSIITHPGGISFLGFGTVTKDIGLNQQPYPVYPQTPGNYVQKVIKQLDEYFAGSRRQFNLSLTYHGTPFQQAVWAALQEIPYGSTCSYSDIARIIGNAAACRAVGQAIHHNPVALIIPCHRVIGKNGQLVGFGGGLEIKQWLLDFEKQEVRKQTKDGK
jgi:O-6-methylguanine DNA methyltransferase